MKRIVVTRVGKFASVAMPFWVIPGSKQAFMAQFGLQGDLCKTDKRGQPVARIDIGALDANGTRIKIGEQIMLNVGDDISSVFAATMTGSLSNEIILQDAQLIGGIQTYYLTLSAKGGFRTVSYPWFE